SAIPVSDRTDYLAWKEPLEEVFKGTVVRAIIANKDGISPVVTHTYFVDEQINTRYAAPIISIVTNKEYLFDETIGIYVDNNAIERGIDWERPAHLEFFETDGTLGFAQNIGMRIHGGVTRESPTKSFRIYAR